MSRASYGADMFSPVRGNASFNDDALFTTGRESDFLGSFREPVVVKDGNSKIKQNKQVPLLSTDKVSPRDNLQSDIKTDKIAEKKSKKRSALEISSKSLSNVTTRRSKSSHVNRKDLGEIQEVQNKVSKTRKENVRVKPDDQIQTKIVKSDNKYLKSPEEKCQKHEELSNNDVLSKKYFSKGKISEKNSEVPVEKCAQIEKPVFLDEKKGKLPKDVNSDKENFGKSAVLQNFNADSTSSSLDKLIQVQDEVSKTRKADLGLPEENSQAQKRHTNHALLEKNCSKSTVPEKDFDVPVKKCGPMEKLLYSYLCERESEKLPDEAVKENHAESVVDKSRNVKSSSCLNVEQEQSQEANIEKMVSDAVFFELDRIRQMFYLQQLQLMRYIDENPVICEMQKNIENLFEENRKLKAQLSNYQPLQELNKELIEENRKLRAELWNITQKSEI